MITAKIFHLWLQQSLVAVLLKTIGGSKAMCGRITSIDIHEEERFVFNNGFYEEETAGLL
jgi:hypothetical protein